MNILENVIRKLKHTTVRIVAATTFGALAVVSVPAQAADISDAFHRTDAVHSSGVNEARFVKADFSISFNVGHGASHFKGGHGHSGSHYRGNDYRYYDSKKYYEAKKYYNSKRHYQTTKKYYGGGHKFHGGNSFKFSNRHRGHGRFSNRLRHRHH